MTLGSRGSRGRCLLVWCGATAALLGTGAVTRAGVAEAATAIAGHRLDLLSLDRALADVAAAVLLGCAAWLWLLTSYVVLEAARGSRGQAPRWLPVGVRHLVLSACGVAVAGTLVAPATAATPDGPHARARHGAAHASVHSPVTGLPLPERAAVTRRPGPARSLPAPGAATVVVAPGDTLWSIAAHGLPPDVADAVVVERWQAIYAANRGRIGPDPDLIVPGLLLHLPRKERP